MEIQQLIVKNDNRPNTANLSRIIKNERINDISEIKSEPFLNAAEMFKASLKRLENKNLKDKNIGNIILYLRRKF